MLAGSVPATSCRKGARRPSGQTQPSGDRQTKAIKDYGAPAQVPYGRTGRVPWCCEHFRTPEWWKVTSNQSSDEHLREIAEKVRRLARQTQLPKAREELLDLADRIDGMAEQPKTARD